MASFNREHGSRVEQGSYQVSTTTGQKMEEVYDAQNNLIGYRPVVDVPAQVQGRMQSYENTEASSGRLMSERWAKANAPQEVAEEPVDLDEEIRRIEAARRAWEGMGGKLDQDLATVRAKKQAIAEQMDREALRRYIDPDSVAASMQPPYTPEVTPVFTTNTDPVAPLALASQSKKAKSEIAEQKSKNPSRKVKTGALLAAGALVLGGGGAVVANATGLFSNSSATADLSNNNIDPALIPPLQKAELVDAFGSCLDEQGGGKASFRSVISSETDDSWYYTNVAGEKVKLEVVRKLGDGTLATVNSKTKVWLNNAYVDSTACVVAADRDGVLTVKDENTIIIDRSKVSPQANLVATDTQVVRGISSDVKGSAYDVKLVVDQLVSKNQMTAAEGDRLMKDYNDGPNRAAEIGQAQIGAITKILQDGSSTAAQIEAATDQEIKADINEKVASLHANNLAKEASVNVELVGEYKKTLVKNPAAAKSNSFTMGETTIDSFNVNVKAGQPAATTK